ncbi:sigma-70 family RNA polymerase sigma factor [Nocardioides marmoribigeumensis]|uniref:RNA polymerase sigma factor (Sigma-70 family) n=1 Tax=Nocardioides marmoribigeumensis TaxID=433649 RepID=A0ABU2BUY2_9ACTN|nr:sigma-70 family RNA polymerase sigma factor [Nocardioides marmoribigeumensis]MDR7362442.1 RNA polymerase sigma factor (sigma-70 family) [Nocardioides marmoribigeumensis]
MSAEQAALGRFVDEQGAALQRFAWLLTRDPERAADLTQTVLLRLARRGVADLADPATYARRALVNEHRSQGRTTGARVRALARLGAGPHAPGPDPAHASGERDAIWRALAALSDRQRAAVVLRYYEDLPDERIGEVLGCRPATVRSLVARAMPVLREALRSPTSERTSRDRPR